MKKEIIYHLCDDSGVNTLQLEVLMPINTVFEHEFGTYEIDSIVESKYKIDLYCERRSKITRIKNQ